MKVLLPKVSRDGNIVEFKSTDVRFAGMTALEKLLN